MRHRKDGRRLGRNGPHRKAMLRNMVTSLLEHGSIRTTETRAKEVRRWAEKLITIGKKALPGTNADLSDETLAQKRLHHYRQILRVVRSQDVAKKILDEYAPLFENRAGGYTRMIKLGPRQGDNAPMSILEFVEGAEAAAEPTEETADAE